VACPLCSDANAQASIHQLAGRLQGLVGLDTGEENLADLFEGIPAPPMGLVDVVLRGLVYEWLLRAGLRYQVAVSSTPSRHYILVRPQDPANRALHAGVAERAWALINERYEDVLSTASIAAHVRCSVSYLTKTFRSSYGMTLGQHLRGVRARAGVELLYRTTLTVEAISRQVGFRAKSNFYAAVRSETGMTPRQLRGKGRGATGVTNRGEANVD
jgi:AraC-like DNA-binding protein